MSAFDSAVSGSDAAILFQEFGVSALHNSALPVSVILEENVSRLNDYGETTLNQYELTHKNADVTADDGDKFTLEDGRIFTLVSVAASDHSLTTWVVVRD